MPVETTTPDIQIPESGAGSEDRATMLAEMARLDDSGNLPDSTPEPESDENLSLAEDTPADLAAQEEDVDLTEDVDAAPEADAEPEPTEVAAAPDAALESIQQAEKRSKERLADHMATERAKFQAEQESHATKLAEADKILADHEARNRRSFDPTGKSKEELMAEARKIHALAIAADPDADPAQRAQAQRAVKDQGFEERLRAAEERADAADAKYEAREQEASMATQKAAMITQLTSTVKAETPLLANMLAGKGAEAAKERCLAVAVALYEQTGETPDVEDVHRYVEDARREELASLGIDPDQVIASGSKAKSTNPEAGEKKSATAPTLGNDLTTSTQSQTAPLTPADERADILKGMSKL